MLAGEGGETSPYVSNDRLQFRVGVLPEVEDLVVVRGGVGAIAPRFVQLCEATVGGHKKQSILDDPIHAGNIDQPSIDGQRRVGLVEPIVCVRQIEQAARGASGRIVTRAE